MKLIQYYDFDILQKQKTEPLEDYSNNNSLVKKDDKRVWLIVTEFTDCIFKIIIHFFVISGKNFSSPN